MFVYDNVKSDPYINFYQLVPIENASSTFLTTEQIEEQVAGQLRVYSWYFRDRLKLKTITAGHAEWWQMAPDEERDEVCNELKEHVNQSRTRFKWGDELTPEIIEEMITLIDVCHEMDDYELKSLRGRPDHDRIYQFDDLSWYSIACRHEIQTSYALFNHDELHRVIKQGISYIAEKPNRKSAPLDLDVDLEIFEDKKTGVCDRKTGLHEYLACFIAKHYPKYTLNGDRLTLKGKTTKKKKTLLKGDLASKVFGVKYDFIMRDDVDQFCMEACEYLMYKHLGISIKNVSVYRSLPDQKAVYNNFFESYTLSDLKRYKKRVHNISQLRYDKKGLDKAFTFLEAELTFKEDLKAGKYDKYIK